MEAVKLSDLEGFLDDAQSQEELVDDDPVIIHIDDNSAIELEGPEVVIPALGLVVREGTMMQADDDGELQPDWSLTLFYEIGKKPSEYVYYEQDGILVSLHNYFYAIGKELPPDLMCQVMMSK